MAFLPATPESEPKDEVHPPKHPFGVTSGDEGPTKPGLDHHASESSQGSDRPEEATTNPESGVSPSAGNNSPVSDKSKSSTASDTTKSLLTSAAGGAAGLSGSASFIGKNKTKLALAGALAAIVIPIVVILLLISLFKLTDIEKLYFDYQFTKVHRVLRARAQELAQAAEDGEITGTAATEVNPTDPLSKQIKDLDRAQLEGIDSSPAQLEQTTDAFENVDTSPEGDFGEVMTDDSITDGIQPIDKKPDESQADVDKAVVESDRQVVQAGESVDTSGPLGQEAQDIETDVQNGLSPEQAELNAAQAKGAQLFGTAAKLSLIVTVSTFWCIARDVYVQGSTAYEKIRGQNLARAGARINTAADAQREGKLTSPQVAGYANEFDNSAGSFTQSQGYEQATGQPTTNGVPINPAALPFQSQTSGLGALMNDLSVLANIPLEGQACDALLNPVGQVTAAVTEVLTTAVAALFTGGQDITFKAVLTESINQTIQSITSKESLKFLATAGAAQGLEYLATSVAANHANANVTGTEGPIQKGNVQNASDDELQAQTLKAMGGQLLPGPVAANLTKSELAYEQKTNYSTVARLFDPKDLYSPASETLAKIPTNPTMLGASINSFADILSSPSKLIQYFSNVFGGFIPKASADPSTCSSSPSADSCDLYNLPQYGFTDAELAQYPMISNTAYIENNPQIATTYGVCFAPSASNTYFTPAATATNGVSCNDPNNTDLTRYSIYLLDKQVVTDAAILYNMVPTASPTPTPGASPAAQ